MSFLLLLIVMYEFNDNRTMNLLLFDLVSKNNRYNQNRFAQA